MRYTVEEIWYMDAGVVTGANDELRRLVCRALAHAPQRVVDYAMDHAMMIMPLSVEKGEYIPERFIRGKSILAFPETILEAPEEEAHFTVLHEVAHLWLRHKSPLLDDLTVEEGDRQEEEANTLARQWLIESKQEVL